MKSQTLKLFAVFLVVTLWTIRSDASDQSNAPGLGPETDTLYVGDGGDNTVKSFNAKSGTNDKAKTFVPETDPESPLSGPSIFGLLVAGGELIVVNQNNGTSSRETYNSSFSEPRNSRASWSRKTIPTRPSYRTPPSYSTVFFTFAILLATPRTRLSRARSTSLQEMAIFSASWLRRHTSQIFLNDSFHAVSS